MSKIRAKMPSSVRLTRGIESFCSLASWAAVRSSVSLLRSARTALSGTIGIATLPLRDRRGVTAAIFAVSLTTLLGLVGLGTEVGTWYVGLRHGQNVVDAAALAGAEMLAAGGGASAAKAAAIDVASRNSFTTGGIVTVTAASPPSLGSSSGNSKAVEVIISQRPRPILARLFMSSPTIATRGVAALKITGVGACVLAINDAGYQGDVSIQGSALLNMPKCEIAANGADPTAIHDQGNGNQVIAYTLVTSGGCSGCSGTSITLTRPASTHQPPTPDPYAAAQTVTLPMFSGPHCVVSPVVWSDATRNAYCGNKWQVASGQTVDLTPGTYFFYNASVAVQGGATLQCSQCVPGQAGVTFILTGTPSKIGSLSIAGNANVHLNAPSMNYAETHNYYGCSTSSCPFGGLLFYMDVHAPPGSGGNTPVGINGNSSTLTGGLYFPSVFVSYSGDSAANGSGCTVLVANNITFTGGSSGMDITSCPADGIPVPQPLVVSLVE
jgi:hypothetical protein